MHDRTSHTHVHMYTHLWPIKEAHTPTTMDFGRWEETKAPEDNKQTLAEHVKLHKVSGSGSSRIKPRTFET